MLAQWSLHIPSAALSMHENQIQQACTPCKVMIQHVSYIGYIPNVLNPCFGGSASICRLKAARDPARSVHISGFSARLSQKRIMAAVTEGLTQCGEVLHVRLHEHPKTEAKYGFVDFGSVRAAQRALQLDSDQRVMAGGTLIIKTAHFGGARWTTETKRKHTDQDV